MLLWSADCSTAIEIAWKEWYSIARYEEAMSLVSALPDSSCINKLCGGKVMVGLETVNMGCLWVHSFPLQHLAEQVLLFFLSFSGNDNTVWVRELANVPVHSRVQDPIPLVPGTRSTPIRTSAVGSPCAWASKSNMGPESGSQGWAITTTVASW